MRTSTSSSHRSPGALVALAIVGCAGVTIAAVIEPRAAEALLRALPVAAVVALVAALVRSLATAITPSGYTAAFDAMRIERQPRTEPQGLRQHLLSLDGAGTRAKRRYVPHGARTVVRREASHRLAQHHGLNLTDPRHHAAIQAMVSRPMWAVIGPPPPTGKGRRKASGLRPVEIPITSLGTLLDELEKL